MKYVEDRLPMNQLKDNILSYFLTLLQAGLWEKDSRLSTMDVCSSAAVYRLSKEQSVVGLIAAGIDHVNGSFPKDVALQIVSDTIQLEQRNKDMNSFIAGLISDMRIAGIYALLVKGQGIAQCYERPQWRACGDVDLFLSVDEYRKAKACLTEKAQKIDEENPKSMHQGMIIDSWDVELHGTLRSGLWKRLEDVIDDAQRAVFYNGNVRSWMNGKTQVFLPRVDEDVIFVFSHILQHFFIGGIGLRQICDWCRLLWTYKKIINIDLLSKRIKDANAMTEWKVFATLAVDYLGMPADAMPLYSDAKKWKKKARKLLHLIIETGNMGHNRDVSYQQEYSGIKRKMTTLRIVSRYSYKQFQIFPMDALKIWWKMLLRGLRINA